MTAALLEVTALCIEHSTKEEQIRSLDGVDLHAAAGQTIGIAGESGSGKSTLAAAIGGLLPENAQRQGGDLRVEGSSVFEADRDELRRIRRNVLGFVFQSPIGVFDPTAPIDRQLRWATGATTQKEMAEILARVELDAAVLDRYPHELSGGMAQRVAIAIAMVRSPRLLVADEPTAALDTSIRADILDLVLDLTRSEGNGLLLFSHDLGSLASYCEWMGVMYGGRIVEFGEKAKVFSEPVHPYTRALLGAALGSEQAGGTAEAIPGSPPVLRGESRGCAFATRCAWAVEECSSRRPIDRVVDERRVLCHRADEIG